MTVADSTIDIAELRRQKRLRQGQPAVPVATAPTAAPPDIAAMRRDRRRLTPTAAVADVTAVPDPLAPAPSGSALDSEPMAGQTAISFWPVLGMNAAKNVARQGTDAAKLAGLGVSEGLVKPSARAHARATRTTATVPVLGLPVRIPTAGSAASATAGMVTDVARMAASVIGALDKSPEVLQMLAKAAGKTQPDDVAEWVYQNPVDALTILQAGGRLAARGAVGPLARAEAVGETRRTKLVTDAWQRAQHGPVAVQPEALVPGRLERAVGATRQAAERVAEVGPIRAGTEAAVTAAGKAPVIGPQVRAMAESRRVRLATREMMGFAKAKHTGAAERITHEAAQKFRLADEDKVRFTNIAMGLEPLPPAGSGPELRAAYDWYAGLAAQDKSDLIRRGAITRAESEARELQPLRIERFKAQAAAAGETPEKAAKTAASKESALGRAVESESLGEVTAQAKQLARIRTTGRLVAERLRQVKKQSVVAGEARGTAKAAAETGVEAELARLEDEIAALVEQRQSMHGVVHLTSAPETAAIEAEVGLEGAAARAASQLERRVAPKLARRDPLAKASSAIKAAREDYLRGRVGRAGKLMRQADQSIEDAERHLTKLAVRAGALEADVAAIKGGGAGPATRRLEELNEEIRVELRAQGRQAPLYFPFIEDPLTAAKRAQASVTTGVRRKITRMVPGFIKRSTGRLYALGTYIKNDPLVVVARHQAQLAKWRTAEDGINEIIRAPFARKIATAADRLEGEVILDPALARSVMRRQMKFSGSVATAVSDGQAVDDAFYGAVVKHLQTKGFDMAPAEIGAEGLYALPRTAGEQLLAQYRPASDLWRLLYDKPTDYWRAAVLALRPAWIANNAISSLIFSTLQGVAPRHYAMALREQFIAKMPDELGAGGFSREITRTNLEQFARSDSKLARGLARTYDFMERIPVTGVALERMTEGMRGVNAAVENFYRRAGFLKAVERSARVNYIQRTNDRFLSAFNLLDELDTLTPQQVRKAIKEVNFFQNDYLNGLLPWERNYLRRAVPFWSFMKHQTKLMTMLPVDYPGRALMLQRIVAMADEARQDQEFLPSYMQDKGLTYAGVTQVIDGENYYMFLNTLGWNPFIIGGGPQNVLGATDLHDFAKVLIGQGGPFVHAAATTITALDAFGRPFTHPRVVPMGKGFVKVDADGEFLRDAHGNFVEAKAPVPGVVEQAASALPQTRLLRELAEPQARYTATPFSTERSPESRVVTHTRMQAFARYFTPISVTWVNADAAARGEFKAYHSRADIRRARREIMRRQEAAGGGDE